MPPRRRKPTQTRKTAAPKTRCRSITSISQFKAALEKGGTKKVVFVQFYQTSMWACKQLRPIFSRYSALPSFKNGIFVEVDTDEYGDIANEAGIKRVPTYQCYFDGTLVDSYTGTAPSEMRDLIERNIKEYCSSSGMPIWSSVLGAIAVVGAAWAASLKFKASGEHVAQNAREQILDIKQRIVTAQARLKNMEKANRGKQAKAQRKLIEQLNAQRRALERTHQAATTKTQNGQVPKAGASRDSLLVDVDYDEIARIRYRKRQGEVLYSDEEDILEQANHHVLH
ncbi:hypothetical protein M9434_003555 [Picochlorum sp. BPE23]|nr:hypothetical protein M9434_003555 [Picochlorum sp. BPE23]